MAPRALQVCSWSTSLTDGSGHSSQQPQLGVDAVEIPHSGLACPFWHSAIHHSPESWSGTLCVRWVGVCRIRPRIFLVRTIPYR